MIRKPEILKVGFWMIKILNGCDFSPDHLKTRLKMSSFWMGGRYFVFYFSKTRRNGGYFEFKPIQIASGFLMPFHHHPAMDHLKFKNVQISDFQCTIGPFTFQKVKSCSIVEWCAFRMADTISLIRPPDCWWAAYLQAARYYKVQCLKFSYTEPHSISL